jgi:hypothetical protein
MTNRITRWEITMEVQGSLLIGEFHALANGNAMGLLGPHNKEIATVRDP